MTTGKIKLALCVSKPDVWLSARVIPSAHQHTFPWNDELFSIPRMLVDRAECETNPSLLQLIPYVLLRNANGRFFCYSRGKGGAEERLHAKLSIGLGGHVDELPGERESLYMLVLREAARELQEEVGLSVDWTELDDVMFVYEEVTEVGRVHFGIVLIYEMTENESLGDHEAGQIEDGEFLTLEELLAPEKFDRLELWSQAVVKQMAENVASSKRDTVQQFGTPGEEH